MQIVSLSGRVVGRAEEPFQIDLPASRAIPPAGLAALERTFQLEPGAYSLRAVVTDSVTGSTGLMERRFEVPAISSTIHSASSLVLADVIQRGNPSNISSSFRLGDVTVRPNFTGRLRRDQDLNLVQQVYNPAPLHWHTKW
jgi:hypothetical protein